MTTSISAIWRTLRDGADRSPLSVRVPDDHIVGSPCPEPLRAGQDYFVVRLEELRLQRGRRWWIDVTPMVSVITSFAYAGAAQSVPVVVGPSLLHAPGAGSPSAASFHDIQVAGAYPFAGGPLGLTVVLYEVPTSNVAQQILGAVEKTATALPFGVAVVPYLAMADAVVSGLGLLLDVGETRPVMGCRHDAAGPDLATRPGYFALVSDPHIRTDDLWVVDGRLRYGASAAAAEPPVECDHVLYRLTGARRRDDARQLSFVGPLWERVVRFASMPDDASWTTAKTNLSTLGQELALSHDLTREQATEMYAAYLAEAKALRSAALDLAHLGDSAGDRQDDVLRSITDAVMRLA